MKNNWTKTVVIGLIAILVLAAGAITVFAQDEPIPDEPPVPRIPFGPGGFHGEHHGRGGCGGRGHRGANDEALADALGITPEDLQDAREKVQAERLAEAVEAGILTQEQVDNMLAMRALKSYLDQEALLAQALGLTPDEFAKAREEGTLREHLDGIAPAQLHENLQTAIKDAVDLAVKNGDITQEQADLVLEKIENGFAMRGSFGHPGFGSRGRFPGTPRGQDDGTAYAPFRSAPSFGA